MIVCPIYAALPPEKQMEAFSKAAPGTRKVHSLLPSVIVLPLFQLLSLYNDRLSLQPILQKRQSLFLV